MLLLCSQLFDTSLFESGAQTGPQAPTATEAERGAVIGGVVAAVVFVVVVLVVACVVRPIRAKIFPFAMKKKEARFTTVAEPSDSSTTTDPNSASWKAGQSTSVTNIKA